MEMRQNTTDRLSAWLVQRRDILQGIGIVLLAAAFVLAATVLWITGLIDVRTAGYPSIFFINLVGTATILLPVPGLVATCAGTAPIFGLHPLPISFVSAVGASIGEMTAYLAGMGGKSVVQKSRHYERVHGWVVRRGTIVLFVMAFIPNPVFDAVGIAAGGTGYPWQKFLVVVFLGKLLKFLVVAYGCFFGIEFIRDLVTTVPPPVIE